LSTVATRLVARLLSTPARVGLKSTRRGWDLPVTRSGPARRPVRRPTKLPGSWASTCRPRRTRRRGGRARRGAGSSAGHSRRRPGDPPASVSIVIRSTFQAVAGRGGPGARRRPGRLRRRPAAREAGEEKRGRDRHPRPPAHAASSTTMRRTTGMYWGRYGDLSTADGCATDTWSSTTAPTGRANTCFVIDVLAGANNNFTSVPKNIHYHRTIQIHSTL